MHPTSYEPPDGILTAFHVKLYPETLKSSYSGLYALTGLLKRLHSPPKVNERICSKRKWRCEALRSPTSGFN